MEQNIEEQTEIERKAKRNKRLLFLFLILSLLTIAYIVFEIVTLAN